jgi:hypothetical protein
MKLFILCHFLKTTHVEQLNITLRAGAAWRYGSGYIKKMRLHAAWAPQQ